MSGAEAPKISSKVDIFSIGVIFFELIYGQKPFGNNMSQEKIFKDQIMLRAHKVEFPNTAQLSNDGKNFIRLLLAHSQDARLDA